MFGTSGAGEPVVPVGHRAVVVAGQDLSVASVGEEFEAIVALAVVPIDDDDVFVEALP